MSEVVMKILLVEDDEEQCEIYRKIIESNVNVKLVAVTNSSTEAIKYTKDYKPDGIILDLELNKGEGSGFEFIENIKKQALDPFPKIVVTTNIYSDTVYDFLHKNKIDFVFYKKQANYSQENVLNTLLLLNDYKTTNKIFIPDSDGSQEKEKDKLAELIDKELDLIGVGCHLKGRKYLFDAIRFIIENGDNGEGVSVVPFLVSKYKRVNSTIIRAMQNAIIRAWRISSVEDLEVLYTARINYETGIPTPTEFIYYYAGKIKKML